MGSNNLFKAILSIVAIILAAGLIVWQLSDKKGPTVTEELQEQVASERKAVLETLTPAVELAAKSGWAATGRYWMPNALNGNMKKKLTQAFGSSFDAQAILQGEISQDGESGFQVVIFPLNGANHAFYLARNKKGAFLLKDFGAW